MELQDPSPKKDILMETVNRLSQNASAEDRKARKIINVDRAIIANKLETSVLSGDESERIRAMMILEQYIVYYQSTCSREMMNDFRVRFWRMDESLLKTLVSRHGLFDHRLQDRIGCLVDVLVDPNNEISPIYQLLDWITDIRRIGEESAEGVIITSNNGLFAMKAPGNNDGDLGHEAVIGIGAANLLREMVPNFIHTYGVYQCMAPITDGPKVIDWCPLTETDSGSYIVLENVANSDTLNSQCRVLSLDEIIDVIIQVFNALGVAHKRYDFTHYDLHGRNILVQRSDDYISIPIYIGEKVRFLRTKIVARIIDYGFSHAIIDGVKFGRPGFEKYGISWEKSFPGHDLYMMTASLLFHSQENPDIEVRKLISAMIDKFVGNWSLKNTGNDLIYQYTYSDYLEWAINFRNTELLENPIGETICSYNSNCITPDKFDDLFRSHSLPKTLYEYYLAEKNIIAYSSGSTQQQLLSEVQNTDIESIIIGEWRSMIEKVEEMINVGKTLKLSISDPPEELKRKLLVIVGIRKIAIRSKAWSMKAGKIKKPHASAIKRRLTMMDDAINEILAVYGFLSHSPEIIHIMKSSMMNDNEVANIISIIY